ncbi:tripartite tricarboxylate transporter substrate binding protein [Aureimonas sp. AU20]|uniref:tripartite tricarboxylate transporter substrate binding protein n=1 Tax=Aureimonas sp. AU20 TaxID=1349819 RepID=UPI00072050CD|nr:tripartite tricarboxylate transporter substrate-binding protein [Aureimonas sp. AU20]ALN71650.1 hypothetical protein M673_02935 [Aureimonas sp. AU20]
MNWTRRDLSKWLAVGGAMGAMGFGSLRPALAAKLEDASILAAASTGGGYDTLARTAQTILQDRAIIDNVEVANVPGAGGTVGLAQFVNAARRDQLLTAGLGMVGAVAINKSPVTLADVTPVARLQGEYQPLVVAAASPLKTLDDLLAMYRENPGSVSWGGFGLGSPDHFVSALVIKASGNDVSKMNYIVVGAGSEMLPLVLTNRVTVATGGYGEFADLIKTGALRALGISSPQRLPGVDIPTFREQGVATDLVNWRGFMGAPGLAGADLAALDEAMGEMARSDQWNEVCRTRGWENLYMNAAEFSTFLTAEQARIGALLQELGLAT